jgi:hypothetical protein
MPGRNDWSSGFTKSAQKNKFIRNRDVKMKDSEVKKEKTICRVMCEGICKRCIDKAVWRFKFDKYKPLKNIGNCQQCKQKVITKAYRTLCDKCAGARKVCPSCVVDMAESNRIHEAAAAERPQAKAKEAREKDVEGGDQESVEMGDEVGCNTLYILSYHTMFADNKYD